MDFFEQQARARRSSRWLVAAYVAAVLFAVASYCVAAGLAYAFLALWGVLPLAGDAPLEVNGLLGAYFEALRRVPLQVYAFVAAVVGGLILAVSAWHAWRLSDGGHQVAYLLGARYVDPDKCTPTERRLLNVVEEMAIASGIAVPPVYVLQHEDAVNALVAGYSPNEAVIVVTRGAVQKLSRDELQGVMGHEFSHILNGDMALNVRLVAVLAGLTWIGDAAEQIIYAAAEANRDRAREERGAGALTAVLAAVIAFIGFPATFAADAIKAAVSRQRELLADAASVQFTRNPDGIAGALDSILSLRAHTAVGAAHSGLFSHMFFAPAVVHWWSFPTHPPIDERIRRAHPRFDRDEYRARRHGTRREVAVIDGSGNVVKNVRLGTAAVMAAVGRPEAKHVDYAAALLARLPSRLKDALHRAEEAEAAMFALSLEEDEAPRAAELRVLEERRGAAAAKNAADLFVYVSAVARGHMLTLADLAIPAIKAQRQPLRDAFLADLTAVVEADRRVTLRELVLCTLLRQRLRHGAGEPISTRFRDVRAVAADANLVLSLVALSGGGDAAAAWARGAAILRLEESAPLPRESLGVASITAALENLRHLSPFAKPAVLKACTEAAGADGRLRLQEVELVRMVAATLDCPIPPVVAAQDPQALAA